MNDEALVCNIEEPIETGWYAYSGGAQTMIFHLRETGQWSVHLDNGSADDCAWGYIEQALGVWDLVCMDPGSGVLHPPETLRRLVDQWGVESIYDAFVTRWPPPPMAAPDPLLGQWGPDLLAMTEAERQTWWDEHHPTVPADLPWSNCTGAGTCPETWHVHGCYADKGQCDDPTDHHGYAAPAEVASGAEDAALTEQVECLEATCDLLRAQLRNTEQRGVADRAKLEAIRADAWDEGWFARRRYSDPSDALRDNLNPYRAALAADPTPDTPQPTAAIWPTAHQAFIAGEYPGRDGGGA